ncbi:hypothetical protein Tco_0472195 [Tanacetum coccineum]
METVKFKALPPMIGPAENRNKNKFCEFHRNKGHSTYECIHLRKQIEETVKSGQLSHLVKEIRQGGKRGKQTKTAKKGEALNKEKATTIFMVQLWQRITRQKTTQSFSADQEIYFSPLRNNGGQETPIVIEAEVEGHLIHRISPSPYNGTIYRSRNAKIPSGRRNSDNPQQHHNTSEMQNGGRNTKCPSTKRTNGHRRNQSSNPPRVYGANRHDRRKLIRKRKNGTLQPAQR